jgi:hypothetical protein
MKRFILSGFAALGAVMFATTLMAAGLLIDDDPGLLLLPPTDVLADMLAEPQSGLVVVVELFDADVPLPVDLFAIHSTEAPERLSASVMVAKSFDLVVSDLTRRTDGVGQLRPG